MNYMRLNFNEVEERFELLICCSDDAAQKNSRHAENFGAFDQPLRIVQHLRDLAGRIETKYGS